MLISSIEELQRSIHRLTHTFGYTTLSILFLVYWSQGFRQFGMVAITYYFKDELGLEPSTAQYIRSISFIAWYIKPIYGMVSDSFPICGLNRKPYLFLAGGLGIISTISFLWLEGEWAITLVLVLFELSEAVADVLADALMVQEARKDPEAGSSLLQTFCWFVLALGGLVGGPLGGYALEFVKPRVVIALQAIAPVLLVISAFIFKEYASELQHESIKSRCKTLIRVGASPVVFRPMLFIYLSSATVPGFSQTFTYFYTDELRFSSTFISVLMCIGFIMICVGSVLYTWKLKQKSLRSVISAGQLLIALSSIFELILITRFNQSMGVPDTWFAVFSDSVTGAISFSCKAMPLFVLSANICPKGVEATMFALLASVGNFGFFTSEFFGGALVDWFGVKQGDYSNFWIVILLRGVLRLSPLLYIILIPKKTGAQDSQSEIELGARSVRDDWTMQEKFNEEI